MSSTTSSRRCRSLKVLPISSQRPEFHNLGGSDFEVRRRRRVVESADGDDAAGALVGGAGPDGDQRADRNLLAGAGAHRGLADNFLAGRRAHQSDANHCSNFCDLSLNPRRMTPGGSDDGGYPVLEERTVRRQLI